MEHVSCDFCGETKHNFWGAASGMKVVRCRNCGLLYTEPRLTIEELSEFYKSEYFKKGGNYTEDAIRMKQYKVDITDLNKVCQPPGKLLDVGCATGLFLKELPDSWEKFGIDNSKEAVEIGKNSYKLNLYHGELPGSSISEYFDVIIMRASLEHVQSPSAYIMKVNSLLKPGGMFVIIALPNLSSIAAKRYRGSFRLLLPRQHLYHFTPKTIKNYLNKYGFAIERTFYPYLKTPYANLVKDTFGLIFNKYLLKESPPYFRSTITIYARKI